MKVIELTKGQVTIVDDEDFEYLAQWRWQLGGSSGERSDGYAFRMSYDQVSKKRKGTYMHRVILNPGNGVQVDHINGNRLDNRRCNLRIATGSQNRSNIGPTRFSKTGVKGVCFRVERGSYEAKIGLGRKRIHLGTFKTLEEASMAYNKAAMELHGEFARLN